MSEEQQADRGDAVGRYERLARAFYRDTGMMAPGKDVPAALGGFGPTIEERRERWDEWLAERPDPEGGPE